MKLRTYLLAFTLLSSQHIPGFRRRGVRQADHAGRPSAHGEIRRDPKEALAEAKAGGAAGDLATLDAVVRSAPQSWSGFDMTGNWQCRTIKAGGISPLVVYDWFKCRVTDDGSGWTLEKVSGSQRTKGRFFDDGDKRLTYLGSFYVNGDPANPYGSGPTAISSAMYSGPAPGHSASSCPRRATNRNSTFWSWR